MMVLGFQPLFKTENTSYKSNRAKITKKKSTLIQIYKHQDPQLWINGKKKRGLISWLVLEKMQQVANTPDVGHGDDVMVWHASSQ